MARVGGIEERGTEIRCEHHVGHRVSFDVRTADVGTGVENKIVAKDLAARGSKNRLKK